VRIWRQDGAGILYIGTRKNASFYLTRSSDIGNFTEQEILLPHLYYEALA
jgi:hypothetical protein